MKYVIPIFSIICITLLEAVALVNEINGFYLAGALILITGLGGYSVARNTTPKP